MIFSGLAVGDSYGTSKPPTAPTRSILLTAVHAPSQEPGRAPGAGKGGSSALRSAGWASPPLKIIKLAGLSGIDHGCHLFRPSPGGTVVAQKETAP